ncbi:MAG: leucine-rich repeat protein [Clostridiales bacterium]|nr:leucine-rich repeat protein [Clostridiales bacterium]
MKNIVNSYVRKFLEERRKSRRALAMLLALALVVTTSVTWELHSTGIAMTNETYCGLEEHTHTEGCYEKVLVCGKEESEGHTHDESCYDEEGNLTCGKEESVGHTHTEDCYEEQLVCGKEEHTHTVECLTDITADVETASDWEATLPDDLTGDWATDVAAIAESQVGYTESTENYTLDEDGTTRKGYTRYGEWYGNEYGDWDAMFASFCLYYAGVDEDEFPQASGAYAWTAALDKLDLYETDDYTPVAGDLVFFDTDKDGKADHVGVVTDVTEEKLTAVEGDSNDEVEKNDYKLTDSTIIGYGALPETPEQEGETSSTTKTETTESASDLTQQTLTVKNGDTTITLSGLLPEGATVKAKPVDVDIEGKTVLMAYDISIYTADGTEFEPEDDTISVTIQSDEISGSNDVYYVPDEGDAEKIGSQSKDGSVVFDAEHFSTYALTVAEDATVVETGDCSAAGDGSVTWTVYSDGTLVIDGEGAMCDYASAAAEPWQTYLGKNGDPVVTTLEIGSGITYIGAYAFIGATNENIPNTITTIIFDEESSLTEIGYQAFYDCEGLTTVELPDSVTTIGERAFYQCDKLVSIELPENLETIGSYAFAMCSVLTDVTIPASVTTISDHAFYSCSKLTSVAFEEGSKLTTIGDSAFNLCYLLNSIELPDTLTSIGSSAFAACYALNSITIPASVTSIGSSAFNQCTGLRSVTFADGSKLTTINASTFKGCSSLTSINLPNTVTSIGSEAFYGCISLASIDLPTSLKTLGTYAFYNCSALTEIDIPSGVTNIAAYTFYGCTSLTTVNLPTNLYTIGAYAFYNCTALANLTLPEKLINIYDYAFYHTDSLTSITVPSTMTSIGEYAFYLSGLESVTFNKTSGISFGSYAFARSSELADVNDETTLSGAMSLLGVTDYTVFYQTALTDLDTTVTEDAIVVTDTDDDGNEVTLTINQTKNSSGDVDYDYLTGEYAFTTVRLESKSADLSEETCRVYIQFDNDGGVIRASDSSGTTTTWTVGDTKTFTTGGTSFSVTLYQVEGVDGFYYLEFGDLEAGATLEFTFATTYTNGTEGGDALIFAEIENTDEASSDGTPANDAYDVQKITWTTEPETYSLVKTGSTASFIYNADDAGVYLTGLKFTIRNNKTNGHSSTGRDYVSSATYSDTMTLPEDLSWRDGLVDAINAGNWYITSSKVVHVIIDGEDYTLCTFSAGMASYMSNLAITVNEDNSITMTWSVKQTSTTSDINTGIMTVTYGDEVIKFTGDADSLTSVTYKFNNTIDAEYSFNYSDETQESTAAASTAATLSQGKLTLDKTPDTGTYYMGSSYTYTITAQNKEALAYNGLQYIEDTLGEWLYLEPDEMESLLNDDKSLTITLNHATLYEVVSDTVTTTDGGSATIDQQMEGTDTVYYGEQGYYDDGTATGTLECSDTVAATGVTIAFAWDGDDLKMTVTYSNGSTETYTIGTGNTYTSISAALNGIGYFVTNDVTYTLLWDLGEDYVLVGNTSLTYSYTATVKDTFMRLEVDQYFGIDQDTATIDSSKVDLGTQNLNAVTAYGEDYDTEGSSATKLGTDTVTGNVYRDFSLVKYLTVSRDGETLKDNDSATDGDIVEYTVTVKHEGTASYEGLPLVDKMAAGLVLLVPVESNTQLADLGLATETVDDVEYYRLTEGTYENVTIYGTTVADKVVVSDEGTMIYCYLNVSGNSTTNIHYLAVIDADADDDEAGFSLTNRVWLNDHETHRLYAKTITDGKVLTIEKQIVTSRGETSDEDEITSRTILSEAGTKVTYRLELENNNDIPVRITGADIYDALPANASGDPWTADDITVTIVTDSAGVTETDLSGWQMNWSITNDDPSTEDIETADTQCYLVWNDDLTLTFTGTVYFYVTLTYPETEEAWDAFTDANLSTDLTNTLHVLGLESQVSHGITVETKASLYKGVLETGLASSKTSTTSSVTYSATTDEDGLWYYTNDSAGRYGYVQYYVVLYNEGPVNLYLNTLEDVLPDGFTYSTSARAAAYTTDLTVTDSEGNELTCVAFDVTATYDSTANKVSFDLSGGNLGYSSDYERYYLEPGQAAVFTYYVWTNAYASTSDTETNTIAMPFYDYSGGGVSLSDEVSAKTVSWDTDYNRNDGEAYLWSAATAADSGMTGEGDDWLASTVTVSRLGIKPGIEKTTSSDSAGSSETLTWSVKVTNDGESTMAGYYVYDVIQNPYYFTGELSYTVYDSAGNSTKYTIGTLSGSEGVCKIYGYSKATGTSQPTVTLSEDEWTYVYAYTVKSSNSAKYVVAMKAWTDSDGNLVLCIGFGTVSVTDSSGNATDTEVREKRAYALPSGGYGVLSIQATSDSDYNYNGVITNTAYVLPSQTFETNYIGNGVEIMPDDGDEIVGARHAVVDEASIAVSYGYSTTSSKSVTELDSDGEATTNTATSGSKDASITASSTDSAIRYTLTVGNGNEAMDELVLLDNLPEEGDTMTLTSAVRRSEYTVLLANPANFTVTVTESDGTATTLTEGDHYKIQYSTSGDVGEADLDTSADSTTTNTWYDSLDEIPEGETVRSFRIVFILSDDANGDGAYDAGDYIPANATVTVTFDATIDGDTVDAGETAYNSFGYLYSAASSDSDLSASPRKVGVQAPTAPKLQKKMVKSDGSTELTMTENTAFTFLIYEGNATVTGDTLAELLASLYANSITTYTTETVTVKAGESASDSVLMGNLNQYTITYNSDDGTYTGTKTDTAWTWTDETTYTIIEIPNADYDFVSWNTTRITNKYTFKYDSSTDLTLTCVNKEQSWTLQLTKVSKSASTVTLPGAVFALYSPYEVDQMSEEDYSALALATLPARTVTTDAGTDKEKTWYLYQVEKTDDSGIASWSNLRKGEEYYLVEVTAPDGYLLSFDAQTVSQSEKLETTVTLTATNEPGYELPRAGGAGTWLFTTAGVILCGGAALVLFKRKETE